MNWESIGQSLLLWGAQIGFKILGAILLWAVGRTLIGFAINLLKKAPMGPVLAVRPYTNNQHYWQVYFDTNRLIRNAFGEAGFPAPGQFSLRIRMAANQCHGLLQSELIKGPTPNPCTVGVRCL